MTLGAPNVTDVSTDRSKNTARDRLKPVPKAVPIAMPSRLSRWPEWAAFAAVFLLAAVATFAGAVALGSRESFVVPVVRGAIRTPPLQIAVAPDAAGLRLTWNPTASQEGAPAVLQIIDGGNSTTQVLDSTQVATGSFLYKPISRDVVFHLSVRGSDGPVDANLKVPDDVLSEVTSSLAGAQHATRSGVDEVAAYDEIAHRRRRRTSSDEAAAYDPRKAAASKTQPFGRVSDH